MKQFFYAFLLLLISNFTIAQVTVDPTFNPTDVGYGDYSGVRGSSTTYPGSVSAQVIQNDGKILLGGSIYGYNGYTPSSGGTINLIRLNADGTRDASFNVGGSGPSGSVNAIALQSDGKIIIGGSFVSYNGITVNGICRLTSSGSFDPTFNPALGVAGSNGVVYAINILSDGKIIIGGSFITYNSITVNGIARLTSSGALDNTFNVGGVGLGSNTASYIRTFAVQPDGRILIGGSFNSYNSISKNSITRINSDGTLDNTFSASLGYTDAVLSSLVLRTDGKIWVSGYHVSNSPSYYTGVLLLNSTGALDPSFAPTSGIGSNGNIYTIASGGNNKLLIAGFFTSFNGTSRTSIARINVDGSLDATFNLGYNIAPTITSIYNIQQNTDGSFIYSGNFDNSVTGGNNSVEKLTANFTIDPTFNAVGGAKGTIRTFATQADGKIIIGGQFNTFNTISRNRIARLTVDGAIDNTFDPGTGANGNVNAIAVQTDGKIIAAGNFSTYNGTATGKIVRTDASGTIDAAFTTNTGTGANDSINIIAVQADGKIIIGGKFTFFNGNAANYLARLNANGTFDNTFNIGSGGFGQVRVVRLQTDGKILIGGDFQFFNSSTIGRIARLNTDGTIDNTFSPISTGANGTVYDIQVATDGSIFVGGDFSSFNGQTNTGKLVRLTSSGVVDNSFVNNYISNVINSISLYSNGKLLLSTTYTGSNTLFRFNSNGSVDNTFSTVSGINNVVFKVAVLTNGNKLLIAGSFTSFNGVGRNHIARLVDATILPLTLQSFTGNLTNNNALLNWQTSNEVNTKSFIMERSANNLNFTEVGIVTATGNVTNSYQFADFAIANLNSKTIYYRLKIQDKDGSFTYSPTVAVALVGKTSIALSPNPTTNIAWLQVQITATEQLKIKVTDISGKEILVQNQTINIGSIALPINVSSLKAGVYYVHVISNYRNETLKLVKQ